MFSTIPRIGISTFSNIAMPLTTSTIETSCGVVTITEPAIGISCESESWTSPVPGGRSQIEVVEVAPVDVAEELLEQAVDHRAAPHDRLVLVDEEADRDHAAGRA